jgi:hypothetical protein
MNEQEIIDALIKGAILHIDAITGDVRIDPMDDVSPDVRECIRASRTRDRKHQQQCPDCLESEAENTMMDAASHREDGNEAIALELEAEAGEVLQRAAQLRGGHIENVSTL